MKLCVVFCCFLALVSTCGVTQHNYIAHKALGWFNPAEQVQEDFGIFLDILQQNQDAFQNGAAFPDWGYSCGESDASEEAHWPPFTLAYTEYFIKQCTAVPGNWTGECPKLVAFLFGIVSHQVADVLWHDLAIVDSTKQGFIQAMANTDFGGNYGDAHSAADAGGEFIIAREFDLSFIQREWYLPAGDLSVLYNRLHHDITPEKLIECNLLLYAEVHAVKEGGALLYPYAARKSGFLSDEIKDYWMGGIDDNSVWTLWCWYEYLMSWLTSDGKDIAEFPVCLAQQPLFGDCPDVCPYPARRPVVSEQILSLATNLVNTTNAFVTEHNGKRGVTISHGSEFSQTLQNNMKELFPAFSQRNSEGDPVFPVVSDAAVQNTTCGEFMSELPSFYGTVANSYVGQSFSSGDLNNDGLTDVIIGAPGWSKNGLPQLGAIHILYGNKSLSALHNNQSISSPFLIGTSAHDRFGWASAILDLNKDGMNDIVVSSPTYSAANLTYRGELSIFWGTPTGVFSTTPNLLISSSVNFTNLGDSLTTFDCDSDGFLDLLVSAPFAGSGTASPQQKGKVILLLASDSQYSSSSSIYIEDIATWILEGDNSNNLFGRHIEPVESSGLGAPSMLIVGAPTVGSGSGSSREIGTVYGYNLDELMKGRDQQTALMFSIKGEDAWDQTGFSFSVGSLDKYSQVLGLAAPARKTGEVEEQFGAVFFYDISSLQGSHSLYGDTNIDVLQGDQRYARFGYRCVFDQPSSNSTSSWWVSQPRRDYNERNPEAGAVFRWNSDRLPEHPRDPLAANECWASTVGKIRFGETLHFADVNGNGVTDVLFGSPRWGNDLVGSYSILIR